MSESDDAEFVDLASEEEEEFEDDGGDDEEDFVEDEKKKSTKRKSTPKKAAAAAAVKIITPDVMKKRLSALSKEQLVDAVIAVATETKYDVSKLFGTFKPDHAAAKEELEKLMKRIHSSFPHSRFGSSGDEYCYKRVSPSIQAFKSRLFEILSEQVASCDGRNIIAFVTDVAAPLVDRMPSFDHEKNNKPAQLIAKRIAAAVKKATKLLKMSSSEIKALHDKLPESVVGEITAPPKKRKSKGADDPAPV